MLSICPPVCKLSGVPPSSFRSLEDDLSVLSDCHLLWMVRKAAWKAGRENGSAGFTSTLGCLVERVRLVGHQHDK